MKSDNKQRVKGEALLEIRGLKIEGNSDGVWHPIVKGVDLTLKRGEVLGLIDDEDGTAADRHQRQQEIVQRGDEVVPRGVCQPSVPDRLPGHDAEVQEHLAEQFFSGQERVEDE